MRGAPGLTGEALSRHRFPFRDGAPWLWALAVLTVVRAAVAGLSPLSPDEAYYWTWSRALAPGYLDHPPMTALWIWAGTLIAGDTALGVRLLSPVAAGVGSLLLAAACMDLSGVDGTIRRQRAIAAVCLLNATLLLGVGAVTMTPDTPLLFFWTAALAALGRLVATGRGAWWLAIGGAIGLALDSKYTVVLPGAGLALWLIATREGRSWLRTPWPWLAAALALLLFAPVLAWNAAHGWASLLKQGGRTGAWQPALAARYLGELLGGQIGLATPFVFVLFVCGMARVTRLAACMRVTRLAACMRVKCPAGEVLLAFLTLPGVLVFAEHALGDRVQANWPSLLYPACAIAAASLGWRWKAAAGFGLVLSALVYLQSTLAPLPLPRKLDITLVRLAGWRGLADAAAARQTAADRFIVADEYGLASELAFALPGRTVLGAEPRWRLFALAHPDLAGGSGLLLRTARRHDPPDPLLFADCTLLAELHRGRAGRVAETYRLYRVTFAADLPAALRSELVRIPAPRH